MYQTCPGCRHRRADANAAPTDVCPRCGLVYSKWLQNRYRVAESDLERAREADGIIQRVKAIVLYVPPKTDPLLLAGRAILFAVFFSWGWSFILMTLDGNQIGQSFMHNVNLVFHEAGHVIFRPFGEFMTVLGGSLGQLLMPTIVMIALLWRNADNFGASLGLWWLAQSLMDLAPYIADARAGRLLLLGGVTGREMPHMHDWHNILSTVGCLQLDQRIAAAVDMCGQLLMLLGLAWGGYILLLQYRNR
jgi:hypothetical protein